MDKYKKAQTLGRRGPVRDTKDKCGLIDHLIAPKKPCLLHGRPGIFIDHTWGHGEITLGLAQDSLSQSRRQGQGGNSSYPKLTTPNPNYVDGALPVSRWSSLAACAEPSPIPRRFASRQ